MKSFIKFMFITFLFQNPVVASPRLFTRGEGIWPESNWGAIFSGAAAGLEGLNLFLQPGESDKSKTVPQPDVLSASATSQAAPTSPPTDSSSNSEPVHKVEINNDSPPAAEADTETETDPLPQGVENQCDSSSASDDQCDKTIDQLVFTLSCVGLHSKEFLTYDMKAQNQQIKAKLTAIVAKNELAGTAGLGLRTSVSKRCDIFLFAIPLTAAQIGEMKNTPGVYAVVPNQPASYSSFPPATEQQQQNEPVNVPGASKTKVPHEKRRDKPMEDFNAYEDLRFISTPEDSELGESYAYDPTAAYGVTTIMVDSGVNALHEEFTGDDPIIEGYIYGLDAWALPQDYTDRGTCRGSKAAGPRYGVAKRTTLLIAKVAPYLGSIIDAMVQILDYLDDKIEVTDSHLVLGHHVMVIQLSWEPTLAEDCAQFEALLGLYMMTYQVVIVVPATVTSLTTKPVPTVDRWPEALSSKYDIIVVGAVEVESGSTYWWSKPGQYQSVNAPGRVKCADNKVGSAVLYLTGNDVAAVQVGALAAYYLGLPETGPFLREFELGIPETVKEYMIDNARVPRWGDRPAIYNLVHREKLQ